MRHTAYMVSWTEREAGWGCRPDGYHFFNSAAEATRLTHLNLNLQRANERVLYGGSTPDEYSSPDNPVDPTLVQITEEMAAALQQYPELYANQLPFDSKGEPSQYFRGFHGIAERGK